MREWRYDKEISRTCRERLLERCKGYCEMCGQWPDWRGLSIHHVKLKGMGGTKREYTDENLKMICGRCHSAAHHIREA